VRRLLIPAYVVPTSPIFVTLMMQALSSSETSVLARATQRNVPKDGILHSHRRENFKSYVYERSFKSYKKRTRRVSGGILQRAINTKRRCCLE
jgi:hypothetical protein